MSKIHVLENNNGQYKTVIHFTVPPGNNSAGKSWKDCALAGGEGVTTVLTVGDLPGQITQAEHDDIVAGNVLEIICNILVESGGATSASLDKLADKEIAAKQGTLQQKYKYYGYEQE
jgi:hypothetical protein